MRIVIDMQGAQTESRYRGIGRYSLSLALAIARQRGEHEIVLALNGFFAETILPIREAFHGILPVANILVWNGVSPTRETSLDNRLRREISERLREAFLQALCPDLILVTSLFEGFGDDAVTSVGVFDQQTPVAVILYDLIPLISPDEHFVASAEQQAHYNRKIDSLKRSNLLLAISNSAKREAVDALHVDEDELENISGAFDTSFRIKSISEEKRAKCLGRYGIDHPFVFYTGGADSRKNLHRLIEAYASLSKTVRSKHRLVLAGRMPETHVDAFMETAAQHGLIKDEIIFTGYVSDEDLLVLYNSCKAFVFPSLHEGFGIPPLEAMSCGVPVIGSDATSLAEVIGLPEALFDPISVDSIRAKLNQVLTDQQFRQRLINHGSEHVKQFTWEQSARRAISAMERSIIAKPRMHDVAVSFTRTSLFKPDIKKIVLLKLDHLGDFVLAIPAIMRLRAKYPFATIDLIVGSWSVSIAESLQVFSRIYPFDYFKRRSSEAAHTTTEAIAALIDQLDSYDIAIDLRRQPDTRMILAQVPAKFKVGYQTFDINLDEALDVALAAEPDTVFKATELNQTPISVQMLRLVDALPQDVTDYITLPEVHQRDTPRDIQIAVFPKAGNSVKEWSKDSFIETILRLSSRPDVDRVNVYFSSVSESQEFELPANPKVRVHTGLVLPDLIRSLALNTLCIANNSFGAHIGGYLGLVVIAIYGGHEAVPEWAPVFGNSYVVYHPVACSPCHIAQRSDCPYDLKCLRQISVDTVCHKVQQALSVVLQQRKLAQERDLARHNSADVVTLPEQQSLQTLVSGLMQGLAALNLKGLELSDKVSLARAIVLNHPPQGPKQLFVDISELVQRDAKSGIQRVVRAVLREILEHPPVGFKVVPVYANHNRQGYIKANRFVQTFNANTNVDLCEDEPILYDNGDLFLGLDLHPHFAVDQRESFSAMRARGVKVYFVVYDLLCVTMPQHFVPGSKEAFEKWLQVVAESDGAICISQAVASELDGWLKKNLIKHSSFFEISHFSLGADIKSSVPTVGLSEEEQRLLAQLAGQRNFLMVGTLEPRKGHAQALGAFDSLWEAGHAVNLVIVGKQGWLVDRLVDRINSHPRLNVRLYWFQSATDEFLEKLYTSAICLLVPSEGEGFGLPLIEAAYFNLPIIARDLPVFKEIAGESAFYFSGTSPESLALAVEAWSTCFQGGTHPSSAQIPRLTWKQSTQQLLRAILK